MTSDLTGTVINALVFGGIGLGLFALSFGIIVAVTPFSIRKEIEADQNTALAILISSVVLGIAIIVGSVVHG